MNVHLGVTIFGGEQLLARLGASNASGG